MQKFAMVFPGQGSQKLGMLAAIAEEYPAVVDTFDEASEILGYDSWEVCQRDPDNNLDQTQITQPVMLTAAIAVWRLWAANGGPVPAVVAGHSLGEYSALVISQVLSFSDAVTLVSKRGTYMQEAVPPGIGAMAAIVGLDDYRIHELCAEVSGHEIVAAANFNSPGQTVIAGHKGAVERAMEACKKAGAKRALALNVSVPSHCALMIPAARRLAADLENIHFASATIPVVQNVCAEIVVDGNRIKQNLIEQLHRPVRWVDSVKLLHSCGLKKIVECGPGKVLCGLIKRIDSNIDCFGTDDVQSFQQARATVSE